MRCAQAAWPAAEAPTLQGTQHASTGLQLKTFKSGVCSGTSARCRSAHLGMHTALMRQSRSSRETARHLSYCKPPQQLPCVFRASLYG